MVNTFTQKTLQLHRTLKNILFRVIVIGALITVCSFNVPGSASIIQQVKVVKCYPNPATSFVNFEVGEALSTKGYALEVYSFAGKKMFETQVSSGKINLTLNQNYYRGIYVYQLKDKSAKIIETGKFQVIR